MYSILIEAAMPDIVEQDQPQAVDPKLCSAFPESGEVWMELGKLAEGREALLAFNHALSLKPDLEEAWYRRGQMLHRQDAFQEALVSLRHAMHDRLQSGAWEEYGAVLREMGRTEEAFAHARQ